MNEFVKNELMRLKNILSPEGPDRPKEVNEDTAGEEEQTKRNREAFVKLALNFLRRRKHDELAEYLQNSKIFPFPPMTLYISLCIIIIIFNNA